MVDRDLRQKMQDAGARRYPEEACGLVIRQGKKTMPVECENVSEYPRQQFRIDPDEYASWADTGEIIGVWHTHVEIPEAPSDADRAACEALELPWYILSVKRQQDGFDYSDVFVLQPNGFEAPYVGRPYVFGVFDCYSLVRDWYGREFDIALDDYPRIHDWYKQGYDFFTTGYREQGFVDVYGQEPQVGDVFVIQSESAVPNHVAVYVGNGRMLHQMHGRLSREDIYGGYWLKHTVIQARHQSKC